MKNETVKGGQIRRVLPLQKAPCANVGNFDAAYHEMLGLAPQPVRNCHIESFLVVST